MRRIHIFRKKDWPLWLSFGLPLIVMLAYFIYRQMFPFGKSSLLTVDLGQQYIDFFAYYRHTLLHDPSALFWSFSKDIGGEMVGVWAYYLMSPFNLIFLAFPGKLLTIGVFIITLLKYAFNGLSFAILLTKTKTQKGWLVPTFATAYALMGWMIANQLNMIWLDVTALLPLIILGLERLFTTGKIRWFVLWMTIMMIDNYYMGYMVALFVVLYWLFAVVDHWQSPRLAAVQFGKTVWAAVITFGLSAWLLLPTYSALTQSKTQYTVTKIQAKLEYAPWKMIGKFFQGSFNFDQMPSGQPNLYIAWIALFGMIAFLINRQIKLSTKIMAGLVTIFLLLSFCFQPLDLLWHAGQFPVWYPYRFSFVFCFWIVWLAARGLSERLTVTWPTGILMLGFLAILSLVAWMNLKKIGYINQTDILVTIGFASITLILLLLPKSQLLPYQIVMCLIVVVEMGSNAYLSLNNISYVSQSDFGQYTNILNKTVQGIQKQHSGFYRIGKTFTRTKDDPMQAAYNGADHFSSTFESIIPHFFGSIGQPDGDGVVTYSNGTLVSDSLLDMRYFMDKHLATKTTNPDTVNQYIPATTYKADLAHYQRSASLSNSLVDVYKNPYSLGLAFGADKSILKLKVKSETGDPLARQELIYQTLANRPTDALYSAQNFNQVIFQNVKKQITLTGSVLQKQNLAKPGQITFKFVPTTNDSYYITLGQALNKDSATFYLNGQPLKQYQTYRHTVAANVATNAKGKTVTFMIQMKKTSLWLQNFTLYKLNNHNFEQSAHTLQQEPFQISTHSNRKIAGKIKITKNNQVLMTTIPYSKGWHVQVDGKAVQPRQVIKTFMAIPLNKGQHQVTFSYWPPYLNLGLIILLLTAILIIGYFWWNSHHRRQRLENY